MFHIDLCGNRRSPVGGRALELRGFFRIGKNVHSDDQSRESLLVTAEGPERGALPRVGLPRERVEPVRI